MPNGNCFHIIPHNSLLLWCWHALFMLLLHYYGFIVYKILSFGAFEKKISPHGKWRGKFIESKALLCCAHARGDSVKCTNDAMNWRSRLKYFNWQTLSCLMSNNIAGANVFWNGIENTQKAKLSCNSFRLLMLTSISMLTHAIESCRKS